jgi:hypothetical protein
MGARSLSWVASAAIVLAVGAGCASKNSPVPVRGVVTVDGKPVAGAGVVFNPAEGGGRPAHGATEDNGSYQLTTLQANDGALPGDYVVTIVWEEPPPPVLRSGPGGPTKEQQQKALQDYEEKMRRAGKPPVIPAIYGNATKSPLRLTVPVPGGEANFALKSKGS